MSFQCLSTDEGPASTGTGMRRDLSRFLDTPYDLLGIGAGVHRAYMASVAALRGLSVAFVDQGDFGAGMSGAEA
jgi:glycerol-3-phosphate dehydrogenase